MLVGHDGSMTRAVAKAWFHLFEAYFDCNVGCNGHIFLFPNRLVCFRGRGLSRGFPFYL